MSEFGPYPESDFYCPIKGEVCEPYGLAVYCSWKNETDNITLRAQIEGAKANSIIQEQIIKNGYNPADRDAIIRMTMENSDLRAQLAQSQSREAGYRDALELAAGALILDAMVDNDGQPFGTTLEALGAINKVLASPGSEVGEKMKRLREIAKQADIVHSMCVNMGDFRNGNTHQGIDEGEVMANRELEALRQLLEAKEVTDETL